MRESKRGWGRNGKIRIEEKWWFWDEEREILKDGKGRVRRGQEAEEERDMRSEGRT